MLNHAPTQYHPLPSTPTYSHPLPPTSTHRHSFLAYSHPLPLICSPLLLFLNPRSAICSLFHPFPVHIQRLSPNPTHHLPFQPTFSPCVSRVYVLQVPVYLYAFVIHVPMCLCNSFLWTLLPMSIHFMCFCVCLYVRTIYFH